MGWRCEADSKQGKALRGPCPLRGLLWFAKTLVGRQAESILGVRTLCKSLMCLTSCLGRECCGCKHAPSSLGGGCASMTCPACTLTARLSCLSPARWPRQQARGRQRRQRQCARARRSATRATPTRRAGQAARSGARGCARGQPLCSCTGSEPWLSARAGGGPGGGGGAAARERPDAQRAPGPRVPAPPPPARPGRPRLARVVRRRGRLAGGHQRRRDGRAQVLPGGGAPYPNPILKACSVGTECAALLAHDAAAGAGRQGHPSPANACAACNLFCELVLWRQKRAPRPHVGLAPGSDLDHACLAMPVLSAESALGSAPSAGPPHSGADRCLHHGQQFGRTSHKLSWLQTCRSAQDSACHRHSNARA
jgi:hypothetical protein